MDRNRQPLISVIIPVYNRQIELTRCLESLSSQIYSEKFEVIIVDDGSTENLNVIVNAFEGKLHLSYFKIDNSGGPARPRNIGAKNSQGKWLSFLDCDDCWDANRLSEISTHLYNMDDGILYHKLRVLDENKRFIPFYKNSVGSNMHLTPLDQFMKCGNPIPNSSAIIDRKSFFDLGGFDEANQIRAFEDFDLWIRAAEKKLAFLFINKCLGSYYISSDSISKISLKIIKRQILFYKKHHLKNFSLESKKRIESYRRYNLGTLYVNDVNYKNRSLTLLKNAKHIYSIKNRVSRILKMLKLHLQITKYKT